MSVLMILPYLTYKLRCILPYTPFIGWLTSSLLFTPTLIVVGWPALWLLPVATYLGWLVFRNTLNKVQAIGRVYWVIRDYVPDVTPRISRGFMHEIDPPWRHGKGLQIKAFGRTIQVGICRQHNFDETSGILAAVQGRFLDTEPIDIGKW
jgi:hypothetical protein